MFRAVVHPESEQATALHAWGPGRGYAVAPGSGRPVSRPAREGGLEVPLAPVNKIWMDGRIVDWEDAQIHVLTHALHYGTGVFGGIRAYETKRGPAVFRLTDHIRRLFRSAHLYQIDVPFSFEAI